jgi:hypothetical protein
VSVERYEPELPKWVQRRYAARLVDQRVNQAMADDQLNHDNRMTHRAITMDIDLVDRITREMQQDDNPLKREALLRRFMDWQTSSKQTIHRTYE